MSNNITFTRRVTTTFIESIPPDIVYFNACLYAIVKRKIDLPSNKWGINVRLDPCEFDWTSKTITITIPKKINYAINNVDDLDPNFFEAIEAAFLSLMYSCVP